MDSIDNDAFAETWLLRGDGSEGSYSTPPHAGSVLISEAVAAQPTITVLARAPLDAAAASCSGGHPAGRVTATESAKGTYPVASLSAVGTVGAIAPVRDDGWLLRPNGLSHLSPRKLARSR